MLLQLHEDNQCVPQKLLHYKIVATEINTEMQSTNQMGLQASKAQL